MFGIRFTAQADEDLFDIYIYTYETWGSDQAVKYTNGLKAAINRLSQEPNRPGTVDRSSLRQGYRSYHQQRHLIFYRVVADDIEIIRILHDNMDALRHLAEEDQAEHWNVQFLQYGC